MDKKYYVIMVVDDMFSFVRSEEDVESFGTNAPDGSDAMTVDEASALKERLASYDAGKGYGDRFEVATVEGYEFGIPIVKIL